MMFLCSESGIIYEHPSKYWLKADSTDSKMSGSHSQGYLNAEQIEAQMMVSTTGRQVGWQGGRQADWMAGSLEGRQM